MNENENAGQADQSPSPVNQPDPPAWESIQGKAGNFALVAGLLALLFAILILACFFTGDLRFLAGGAGALATSLWLYQSSQLLHIRALLLKNSEHDQNHKS